MNSPLHSHTWLDRNFTRLLPAIAAAGLIPCLIYGNYQFIGYDGWWHLFIATQDRWRTLLEEWKFVAHPPLLYPLLRFVTKFGHAHLILRSIGILSGCISTYLIGVIASKLYQHKAVALLTALAYACSWSIIDLSCEVRAYALALLFVLLAFNAYIDWTIDPAGPRSGRALVRFGVYSTLALLSEFYVVFFLVGCLGIVILRFIVQPAFRRAFLNSLRAEWKTWLCSGVVLSTLFAALYVIQILGQPSTQFYLKDYYWDDNSSLGLDGFLLTNFQHEIAYFTPFNIDPGVMLGAAGLLFLPALIYFAFVRKNRWRVPVSADSPLLLAILIAQLLVLSLAAHYPFGGELRHQSIIAPFVFLTAFLLLDRLAGALKPPVARNALFTVAALLSVANLIYGFTGYTWDSAEINAADYPEFVAMFPKPDTVYGELTSTIFYYAEHHNARWTFQDRFLVNGQRIAAYVMDDGTGHPVRVLRNKRVDFFDLRDPEMYQVLAGALRHEGLKSAVLFYEGLKWSADSARIFDEQFHKLAALAGLECGRYSLTTSHAFIEFKLP